MKNLLKFAAALAVIGGVVALLVRYADKLKALCPCCKCDDDCGHDCDCQCQEEAPVEEAPAEEAPVEEAPVEETPAEETPAEETVTTEDFAD